jgi:hypothetical protein
MLRSSFLLANYNLLKKLDPGGISVHGNAGVEPGPCGFYHEVAVNFAIPGNTSPKWIDLDRNDLSGIR